MARNIDTNGERTIGCITKIDIMDRGTDARSTLMNKGEVPLRLGYVGIKNRSQGDINENKTVTFTLLSRSKSL
jgi:replication fork clamp-binding protein CrfC